MATASPPKSTLPTDKFALESVPSGRLVAQLAGLGRDRPVYRLGRAAVPILTWTAEATLYQLDPRSVLKRPTALYLSTDTIASNLAAEEVAKSSHAAAEVRSLDAAVARDLAGQSEAALRAARLGPTDYSDQDAERMDRRDVARGRRLWAAIGAWPWWTLAREAGSIKALAGKLPEQWWESPGVIATYRAWATGSQRPLHEHDRRAREAA